MCDLYHNVRATFDGFVLVINSCYYLLLLLLLLNLRIYRVWLSSIFLKVYFKKKIDKNKNWKSPNVGKVVQSVWFPNPYDYHCSIVFLILFYKGQHYQERKKYLYTHHHHFQLLGHSKDCRVDRCSHLSPILPESHWRKVHWSTPVSLVLAWHKPKDNCCGLWYSKLYHWI